MLQIMSNEELQRISFELDQALYNHLQWHKNLIRTFACRSPCDKHDIIPKAHKECRFGQWYYGTTVQSIADQKGFIAIGEAHQQMHRFATNLLINLNENHPVSPMDYDHFSNALERLQLEIHALKNEIESKLNKRDPLTMTSNRVSMLPVLREQQELSKRELQTCCLAMLDIDFFKKVNDKHGHIVGDKVLAMLARYLMDNLRPYDKIFRYGGEEFLICIPHSNVLEANKMIDRLRAGIATIPFNVGLPKPLHITVSCGIALLDPNVAMEISIDNADSAMYLAKSNGRNRTEIKASK